MSKGGAASTGNKGDLSSSLSKVNLIFSLKFRPLFLLGDLS